MQPNYPICCKNFFQQANSSRLIFRATTQLTISAYSKQRYYTKFGDKFWTEQIIHSEFKCDYLINHCLNSRESSQKTENDQWRISQTHATNLNLAQVVRLPSFLTLHDCKRLFNLLAWHRTSETARESSFNFRVSYNKKRSNISAYKCYCLFWYCLLYKFTFKITFKFIN